MNKKLLLRQHFCIIMYKEVTIVVQAIIGERIKTRRLERGWSMQKLADEMGYANKSAIARIERGETDLPQSRISEFARVLGTTPAHLMGWDVKAEEAGATAAKVLKNPDTFRFMLDYLACDEADQYALRLMAKSAAEKAKQKKD